MSPFGVPIDRLHAIAARHTSDLEESERIALVPIAEDDDIDPTEFLAFIRFRAMAILRTSFRDDPAALRAFLAAVDIDQVRVEL